MQSPLGSPIPLPVVVEDFKESLKDLHVNNRIEINTLTMIAKENSEHAQPISRVLENHIKQVATPRKLPALYVLDSIVKNVGAPYTLFFGKGLYSTFIDAYTAMDTRTRANMESMLQTWKEPVPGSMETKPVFPIDATAPIENALRRAKAAAYQQKQSHIPMNRQPHALPPRPSSGAVPVQSWGTPPVVGAPYPPPPHPSATPYSSYTHANGYSQSGYPQYQQMQSYYQQPAAASAYPITAQTPQQYYPPPQATPVYAPPVPHDFAKLNSDIEALIESMKYKLATNMHDSSLQARLQAMLDLKEVINRKSLSQQDWDSVRDRLVLLINQENSPPYNTPPYTRQPPTSYQFAQPPPSHSQTPLPSTPQSVTTQPSYADLYASLAPQHTPSPSESLQLPLQNRVTSNGAGHSKNNSVENFANGLDQTNDLISRLVKSGFVAPTPSQQQQTGSRTNSVQQTQSAYAPPAVTSAPSSVFPTAAASVSAAPASNDLAALYAFLTGSASARKAHAAGPALPTVHLSHESIKTPRSNLIDRRLYKAMPSQCMTCGRRFPGSSEGKARKARHLDYHFRTNARIRQAETAGRRGFCRAWLSGALEWVSAREWDNADETTVRPEADKEGSNDNADVNGADTKKKDVTPYVLVPDQGSLDESVKKGQPLNVCPICQDNFKGVWHDEVQEWVWLDAVKAGTRTYHASCYAEVKKDQEKNVTGALKVPSASSGVLGKRKLDEETDDDNWANKSPKQQAGPF